MDKWKKVIASDFIEFNPKESIKKGGVFPKIAMDLLSPFTRKISSYSWDKYNGGAKFRNQDTIMARITPCLENGKTAMVTILPEDAIGFGSTEYIVFRAKSEISDSKFIYYLACSDLIRNTAIKSMVGSSGRQRVQQSVLNTLEIFVPDLKEQKKIASILSAIDDKIELNEAINNNLLEQVQLLFECTYLSGDTAKMSDLICEIESGSRPKGGALSRGIPSIGAEKIERFGIYDFSSEKYVSEDFFAKLKRGIVNSADVLLYKDGAYTGKVSMALDNFPHAICAVNEHVFILRTDHCRFQNYLYCCLSKKEIRDMVFALASSKAAQPGLNQNEVMGIEINLPIEDILISFENTVSPLMHLVASNANENKRLAELRDSLLPKLMSGELDVSDIDL